VVNASIDGEGVKRALIPFRVLNAEVWYKQLQKEKQLLKLRAQIKKLQAKVDAGFALL
jgi:hypothetical protein